jgi:hypothetical protein
VTSEFPTPEHVAILKFMIALGATALLLWGTLLRRAGRAEAFARSRGAMLLGFGLLGAFGWWNFGQLRFDAGFGHPLDTYHYYIGAKYFDELGYTRLYECTTVADAESGLREQALGRSIRNLETYQREPATIILGSPERCTRHFSPERWQTFKADIRWFRERIPEGLWRGGLSDHGYNPSPAWGGIANLLIGDGPLDEGRLVTLLLIDPVLLAIMWAFLWRAFGWRATCVALVFWGCNLPGDYLWTGGAFLRQLWLAALGIGLALLRSRNMAAAGFFLALAAWVRVFPAVVIVAIGIPALLAMWRERRCFLSPAHRRFAAGCAAVTALVVPLSFATAGGSQAWVGFSKNIAFHSATPFVTNIGAKTALAYAHASRLERIEQTESQPDVAWIAARRRTLDARRFAFIGLVLGYGLLLVRAVDGREDWVAAALGTGAVVILATMSNYYFAVLTPFALLWLRRESIGAGICALAAFTCAAAWFWARLDQVYAAISLATLGFVIAATAAMAFGRRGDDAASDATPSDGASPPSARYASR